MYFQVQKDSPEIEKAANLVKVLTSEAVSSITIYGKVEKIEGRIVTVLFNQDKTVIELQESAVVSLFPNFGEGDNTPKVVELGDVQQGQTVSVRAKIADDGSLQGESLIVFYQN